MKSKFNLEIGSFSIVTSCIQAERDYGMTNSKICSEPEDHEPREITQ